MRYIVSPTGISVEEDTPCSVQPYRAIIFYFHPWTVSSRPNMINIEAGIFGKSLDAPSRTELSLPKYRVKELKCHIFRRFELPV